MEVGLRLLHADPHLEEALKGADCFIGLSVAGAVTQDMALSMAASP